MQSFLSWYAIIFILGWLTFPLTYRLFPALSDRGYCISKILGLLLWGYCFWLMASLGIVQNDWSGLTLALLILIAVSIYALFKFSHKQAISSEKQISSANRQLDIVDWFKSNLRLVLTVEITFLVAFAFLAFVRACNPEIIGTEKPMELAFINAILRSPTFPPRDPWLSGYAISYYYFGFVMTAILAKVTNTLGSVAFNLMLALVFALSAVGVYGILYNLLAAWQRRTNDQAVIVNTKCSIRLSFFGPVFLLLVSNIEGFLEVLHRYGLFWKFNSDGTATSSFWNWLNIKELVNIPAQPLAWIPNRYWWWWRASRVVQDFDLAGRWREIIDEFPFFSYLLGDLHPHVIAMPFSLLAVAVTLNLFMDGWRGETHVFGIKIPINRIGFFFSALVLGGLAFLNTWDILFGFALVCGSFLLLRVRVEGFSWKRVEELFLFGLPLGILSLFLYFPFYLGFSSQFGGFLPNLDSPTRGAHLWVMFGSLFIPIFTYLAFLLLSEKLKNNIWLGIGIAAICVILLWGFSWLLGCMILFFRSQVADIFQAQGFSTIHAFFYAAIQRRLSYTGGWLPLFVLLGFSLAFLIKAGSVKKRGLESKIIHQSLGTNPHFLINPHIFILLLIFLATLFVLFPEFIYIHDQFGNRMNTIFKFYYQAWMMWSIAAAFSVVIMLQKLKHVWLWFYRFGLTILLLVAFTYPVLALCNKTNDFYLPKFIDAIRQSLDTKDWENFRAVQSLWTLDGAAYLDNSEPSDADGIRWLQSAPDGFLVEAIIPNTSYSYFGRMSTHTGLPTVLGWPGHESQWRGGYDIQGTRVDDIRHLYETSSWDITNAILQQYKIRYVVVGNLERSTYRVDESKFQTRLTPIFQAGSMVIYEVPK